MMKNTGKYSGYILPLITLLFFVLVGSAQQQTEVFIPVGKSPGVSDKVSVIGKIESINKKDSVVILKSAASDIPCQITHETAVYLDKSRLKQRSQKGTFADIKQGMMAEVKHRGNNANAPCEWIKVQLE